MLIFSGSSNIPLANKIAKALGFTLQDLEIFIFPDGERRIRVLDKVLGADTFVVQSTSKPADENYMELFFIIDALKRSGAKSITCVVPYFGYQRQDHIFREGEAVSAKVIAKIFESIGINKLIAVDLHSIKIKEAFKVEVVNLSAVVLFARKIIENGWDKDASLVSPDMGGIRRIKILSEMLNSMPFAVIEKNRDLSTGEVSASKIEGQIMGKAIIVDDMISSGETISKASELLSKKGVKEIIVFATHPVFSKNAPKILQESYVKKVFVTDTIYIPKEKQFPKLEIISVADIIAEEIKNPKF